jgi:opacity protein-like surface antigen
MKRMLLLGLLPLLAVAAMAQESRQDVSGSVTGIFVPDVFGDTVHEQGTSGIGGLGSYRYMMTPRSAIEANYQYSQHVFSFQNSANAANIHSRMQEVSGAYVFNLNYGNFNPFVEVGAGGYIFTPILDSLTTANGPAKQSTNIGFLYGAGLAYEISPSFDIRAEFRGIYVREPYFGIDNFRTGVYNNLLNPTLGIAYHF